MKITFEKIVFACVYVPLALLTHFIADVIMYLIKTFYKIKYRYNEEKN